jgi:CHAT domain-containing protein
MAAQVQPLQAMKHDHEETPLRDKVSMAEALLMPLWAIKPPHEEAEMADQVPIAQELSLPLRAMPLPALQCSRHWSRICQKQRR